MKRLLKFSLKACLVLAIVFASVFGAKTFAKNKINKTISNATEQTETIQNMSIFIRKPTYSCFVNNKIYFIDDYDKLLKVYDTTTSYFKDTYLDLSDYEIIDVTLLDDMLFLIVSAENDKNKIIQIKLTDGIQTKFEIITFDFDFDNKYTTLFVQNITFDEETYLLVSLTPNTNTISPQLVLIDSEKTPTFINLQLSFSDSEAELISQNLIKVFTTQNSVGAVRILFAYGSKISYITENDYSSLIARGSTPIQGNITIMTSGLSSNESDVETTDINFIEIDGTQHILETSFNSETEKSTLKIYPNTIESSSGVEFVVKKSHECPNANFMLVNENTICYADNQTLYYVSFDIESATGNYDKHTAYADNPEPEANCFEESAFIYKTTTKVTKLLAKPWDSDEIIMIEPNQDIIHVGSVKIKNLSKARTSIDVPDYDYCMYTFEGKNYLGYVKNSDLQTKQKVELKDSPYTKIVKVWPNTSLYSLPTNIVGTMIKTEIKSERIDTIADNSRVEIVDLVYNYKCNGIRYVKVLVNNTTTGYIDASRIYAPKQQVEFVITNATIGRDATKVYLSASESSVVIYELNAGKQVRIDGKRNTSSGFTQITFNDEYGNEFTGFISSDYIKADSWSTMQIIGSILIAINIGLLILIIVYKNKRITRNNQKLEEELKEENS